MLYLSLNTSANALVVAISSTPNNLDPHYATDANSQDINRLIHLSLVDIDAKMNQVCRACSKYEELREPGGKHTIRFWIKKGLKFQDGSEVAAHDVVRSTQKLLANRNAPVPTLFKELRGAKAVSNEIVELNYNKYMPENLTNLSLLKIESAKNSPAGQFKLVSKSETQIILQGPYKIEFKVVADETTMALKLLNNEVDVIATSMSPRKTQWLGEQKGVKLYEIDGTNYVYIAPMLRHPDLKSEKVRKALSHLIPRKELAEYKQKNTVALAEGMFSSAFGDLFLYRGATSYDPEKAKKLLKEDGYEMENGRWKKNKRELSLLLKISNKKHIIELANALVPYFESNGVGLRIQASEWGTFYRDLKAGNFDLALGQWVGFVGPDQMGFTFLKESFPPDGANRGFYVDEQFEDFYKKAVDAVDTSTRKAFYKKAYERIVDTEAYISLWHPKIIWAARECVKKISLYPTGNFLSFENLEHSCQR